MFVRFVSRLSVRQSVSRTGHTYHRGVRPGTTAYKFSWELLRASANGLHIRVLDECVK